MAKEIKEKFTFQLSSLEPFFLYQIKRLKPFARFFPKTTREIIYLFLIYLTLSFFFFSKNFLNYYIAGDFTSYWLPHYPFLLSSVRDGYLPYWNPYSVLGIPELFKLEMGYFYPPILFTLILNYFFNPSNSLTIIGKSFEVLNYFHLFIGMLGTFLFVRKILKLKYIPALLGGICYSFTPFGLWGLTSLTPNMGNMLFPLLMYSTYVYLQDFTSIKKYMFLIFLNICIFTLGDPYLYFYFFLAQVLLAFICFGFKGLIRFGVNYGNSLLIAAPLLFPSFHMLTQSNRSEGVANSFSQQWSFLPTRVLNIFNPLPYNDINSFADAKGLFSGNGLYFSPLLTILFFHGISSQRNKKNSLFLYLIYIIIFGLIYSLNYYSGLPELSSKIFPFINTFRSHMKISPLIIFGMVCFFSFGLHGIIRKRKFDRVLDGIIVIVVFSFFLSLFLLQSLYQIQLQDNSETLLSSTRIILFFMIYYFFIKAYYHSNRLSLLICIFILLSIEMFSFVARFDAIKFKTSYSNYYGKNDLILNNTDNTLIRYEFENNQFGYSTLPIRIFSREGYESATYIQSSAIKRLGRLNQLQFSNVKYIITTDPQLELKDKNILMIKHISPDQKPNQTFISCIAGLSYCTSEQKNIHYIYEVKDYLPRFYIPKTVIRCDDGGGCLQQENPPEIVVARNIEREFINPTKDFVKIKVISYTPNTIELKISSPQNTFIASSEILDKGWSLRINGTKSDFYNVSDGFRGFIAPSGDSTITMNYFPPFLREGSIFSFFGLLILLSLYKSKFYIVK